MARSTEDAPRFERIAMSGRAVRIEGVVAELKHLDYRYVGLERLPVHEGGGRVWPLSEDDPGSGRR